MPFADDLKERMKRRKLLVRWEPSSPVFYDPMERPSAWDAICQKFYKNGAKEAAAAEQRRWLEEGMRDAREEETGMGIMAKYLRGGYSEKG